MEFEHRHVDIIISIIMRATSPSHIRTGTATAHGTSILTILICTTATGTVRT
jgi:hypothetical protein